MNNSIKNTDAMVHALRTALGMVLATFIAAALHFSAPYWAAITVVAIMSPYASTSFNKGLQRLVGTVIGACIGLALASVTNQNIIMLLIVGFLIISIGQYFSNISRTRYAWILGTAAALLVFASMVGGAEIPFQVAIWRSSEIILGVLVVWIISAWVFPKNPESITQPAQAFFTWTKDPIIIKHSIKTGLAMMLALYLWLLSAWPGGIQGIVSVLAISTNIYISEMQAYSWRRLLGCAIGGAVGLISLHFLIYNITDLLIIVFFVGWVFAYYTFKSKKYSYAALQANVAFALALIQTGGPTNSIAPSLERLSGIFLGIISIMLINYLVWPLNKKDN